MLNIRMNILSQSDDSDYRRSKTLPAAPVLDIHTPDESPHFFASRDLGRFHTQPGQWRFNIVLLVVTLIT